MRSRIPFAEGINAAGGQPRVVLVPEVSGDLNYPVSEGGLLDEMIGGEPFERGHRLLGCGLVEGREVFLQLSDLGELFR